MPTNEKNEGTEMIETMVTDLVDGLWQANAKSRNPITSNDVWLSMKDYVVNKYPGYDGDTDRVESIYSKAVRRAWSQFQKERIAKTGSMSDGDVFECLMDFPETSGDAVHVLKNAGYADGNIDAIRRAVAEVLYFQKIPAPDSLHSAACQRYGRAIADYILSEFKSKQ
jgi:hypothetical protein